MRLCLSSIILATTVLFAMGHVDDPRVRVKNIPYPKNSSIVETDFLALIDTEDQFLQIRFSTVHTKGSGLQGVTLEALFLAGNELYERADKREFSLILNGDRYDFGPLMYSLYTVEEKNGEAVFYAGSPTTRMNAVVVPADARVRRHVPTKNLIAGRLNRIILPLARGFHGFGAIEKSKQITLKLGSTKIRLSEDQVKTLQTFISRGIHG